MATSCAALSITGGSNLKPRELWATKLNSFGHPSRVTLERKSNQLRGNQRLSICAQYNDGSRGGGGDFVTGFIIGGALAGTLAYIFAPQIRRSLLNEDEYGFRKAKRPMYYDEGLEKTRQTLNAKISQLNSAIDNVSSRLRGGNNVAIETTEMDSEVDAAI